MMKVKDRTAVLEYLHQLMVQLNMFCLADFQLAQDMEGLHEGTSQGAASPLWISAEPWKVGHWPYNVPTSSPAHIFCKLGELTGYLYKGKYVPGTPFFTKNTAVAGYPHNGGVGLVPLGPGGEAEGYAVLSMVSKFDEEWDTLFAIIMQVYALTTGIPFIVDVADGGMDKDVKLEMQVEENAWQLFANLCLANYADLDAAAVAEGSFVLRMLDPINHIEFWAEFTKV